MQVPTLHGSLLRKEGLAWAESYAVHAYVSPDRMRLMVSQAERDETL